MQSVEESFNAPPPRLWKERLGFNNATCPGLFPGPGRFELSVFSKAFVVCAILESYVSLLRARFAVARLFCSAYA